MMTHITLKSNVCTLPNAEISVTSVSDNPNVCTLPNAETSVT
jgi:hypothetical protein